MPSVSGRRLRGSLPQWSVPPGPGSLRSPWYVVQQLQAEHRVPSSGRAARRRTRICGVLEPWTRTHSTLARRVIFNRRPLIIPEKIEIAHQCPARYAEPVSEIRSIRISTSPGSFPDHLQNLPYSRVFRPRKVLHRFSDLCRYMAQVH